MSAIDDVIRHVRAFGEPDEGDEWPLEGCDEAPLQVFPRALTTKNLFLTKHPLREWFTIGQTVSIFSKYALFDDPSVRVLAKLLNDLPSIVFVGDMDPIDLTAYLFLRDRLGAQGIDVIYGGVDSRWLELAETFRRISGAPIRLPRLERENWAALTRGYPEIRERIGQKGAALLDAGMKVEIEGATNPLIYGEAHGDALAAKFHEWYGIELTPVARR